LERDHGPIMHPSREMICKMSDATVALRAVDGPWSYGLMLVVSFAGFPSANVPCLAARGPARRGGEDARSYP